MNSRENLRKQFREETDSDTRFSKASAVRYAVWLEDIILGNKRNGFKPDSVLRDTNTYLENGVKVSK